MELKSEKKQLTLLDKTNGKICITPIKGLQLIFEKKMVNLQISPVFYSMQLHGIFSLFTLVPGRGYPGGRMLASSLTRQSQSQ